MEKQQSPDWAEGLSRLVVASAVYGNLVERLPGAFRPALFGKASALRDYE